MSKFVTTDGGVRINIDHIVWYSDSLIRLATENFPCTSAIAEQLDVESTKPMGMTPDDFIDALAALVRHHMCYALVNPKGEILIPYATSKSYVSPLCWYYLTVNKCSLPDGVPSYHAGKELGMSEDTICTLIVAESMKVASTFRKKLMRVLGL